MIYEKCSQVMVPSDLFAKRLATSCAFIISCRNYPSANRLVMQCSPVLRYKNINLPYKQALCEYRAHVQQSLLTLLFQASIHQSLVPLDWKHANIMPIFKKGDRSLCSNNRPVSLTCICSKIVEHIVYSHISSHLSQYDILCNEQHGFRNLRSCKTQLLLTVNDL